MLVDAHLHCSGHETTGDVLNSLDEAGVDIAVLLAPFLTDPYRLTDRESLRAGNEHLSNLVRGHTDRLIGFAVVNPLHPQAADDLEEAIDRGGLRGLKLVPTGWYPYDELRAQGLRARRQARPSDPLPQRDFHRRAFGSVLPPDILRGGPRTSELAGDPRPSRLALVRRGERGRGDRPHQRRRPR